MRTSKLIKNILTYLPVLAVLAAAGIGLFLGKNLYPASSDSLPIGSIRFAAEQKDPQLLLIPGAGDPCFSSYIYTSLPPKCKTFEGKFVPLPGTSTVFVIPQGK